MTNQEQAKYIGKLALLTLNGMAFKVKIADIRSAYGRIDAKVKPLQGSGDAWVSLESLKEVK